MTPNYKAEELAYKMLSTDKVDSYSFVGSKVAKQCALIAVDEILDIDYFDMSEEYFENTMEYWQQVKQEIVNL